MGWDGMEWDGMAAELARTHRARKHGGRNADAWWSHGGRMAHLARALELRLHGLPVGRKHHEDVLAVVEGLVDGRALSHGVGRDGMGWDGVVEKASWMGEP